MSTFFMMNALVLRVESLCLLFYDEQSYILLGLGVRRTRCPHTHTHTHTHTELYTHIQTHANFTLYRSVVAVLGDSYLKRYIYDLDQSTVNFTCIRSRLWVGLTCF